jgi:hypothetical protein
MIILRVAALPVGYLVANQVSFLVLASLIGDPFTASLLAILAGLAGAVALWKLPVWQGRASLGDVVIAEILKWAVMVGAAGFCLGFFGPMILAPGANQGPLLGLFITGPLGAVAGAIGGYVVGSRRERSS